MSRTPNKANSCRTALYLVFLIAIIIWTLLGSTFLFVDNYSVNITNTTIRTLNHTQPFQPKTNFQLGSIYVGDKMDIRFNLTIHHLSLRWGHILQIGTNHQERLPLIALRPNDTTLHIRFSTYEHWNSGIEYLDEKLSLDTQYQIHVLVMENRFILDINNDTKINETFPNHISGNIYPVYAINPWGAWLNKHTTWEAADVPANATISNLKIVSARYQNIKIYPYQQYMDKIIICMIAISGIGLFSMIFVWSTCYKNKNEMLYFEYLSDLDGEDESTRTESTDILYPAEHVAGSSDIQL